jgi:type VI protein secretion system component Hcp
MSGASESSIFLSYDGVTGETVFTDGGVRPGPGTNWIQLLQCALVADANVQARAMSGQGGASLDFGGDAPPIKVVKQTDAATVGLMREMLAAPVMRTATITFVRTDTDGPAEYLRFELVGCNVVGFEFLSSGEDRSNETFDINYKQLTIMAFAGTDGAKGAQATVTLMNGS